MKTIVRTFQTTIINSKIASRFRLMPAVAIVALAFLAGAVQTQATILIWTNQSENFSTSYNWNPVQVPAAGDTTSFTNDTPYTVTLNTDSAFIDTAVISNHAGVTTFDLNGHTWYTTNVFIVGVADSTSTVYVTDSGTLLLTQQLHPPTYSFTGAQLHIADNSTKIFNCVATMVVSTGATVGADYCIIGSPTNSVGTLIIDAGTYSDASGNAAVEWMTVGTNGSSGNQLIVTNGGQLTVDGTITIGSGDTNSANSYSSINNSMILSGPSTVGSINGAGDLKFQGAGGQLLISNSAKLFMTGSLLFGNNASWNTGVLAGAGSAINAANFQIGLGSAGATGNVFTVRDGASLSCAGTFAYGNNVLNVSNGVYLGGAGALSTVSLNYMKSPSSFTNHFGNFLILSNVFVTSSYFGPQAPQEVIAVLSNATWTFTNSFITTTSGQSGTNCFTMGGNAPSVGQTLLLIDSGALINLRTADGSGNGGGFVLGSVGHDNLVITNGGKLLTSRGTFGAGGGSWETGVVTGVGSVWSNFSGQAAEDNYTNLLIVGTSGATNNFLGFFNGAELYNNGTFSIGNSPTSFAHTVCFGGRGPGTVIVNNIGSFNIGSSSGTCYNALIVTNASFTSSIINVGNSGAISNRLQFNGGTISVDFMRVRPTNTVVFTAGDLQAKGLTFDTLANDSNAFVVGDGVSPAPAYYDMVSGGTGNHNFNNGGLVISTNAWLRGSGTIEGNVTVLGTLSPGFSVGSIVFSNDLNLVNAGSVNYDLGTISVSQDSVTVFGTLVLGGVLNVTANAGFTAGTYTLITCTNLVTPPAGTLTTQGGTLPGGYTYAVSVNNPSLVQLIVSPPAPNDPFMTWQSHYFPSLGANSAGTIDADGDGVNNTNEFLSGFNPTNAAAYAHIIKIVKSNGDMVVTYLGANGDNTYTGGPTSRTNVLEYATGGNYSNNTPGFFATAYTSSGGGSIAGTNILTGGTGLGANVTVTDTGGATGTNRYYRIRVIAP